MPAKSILLCQAIADHLNATVQGATFTAVRFNMAFARLEDSRTAVCYVTPVGLSQEIETRGSWIGHFDVALTLVQVMNTNNISEGDELIALSEELPLYLLDTELAGMWLENIEGSSPRSLFEESEMESGTLFRATVTITFRSEV